MNRDDLLREVAINLDAPLGPTRFTAELEDHYRTTIADSRRPSMLIAGGIGMAVLWLFVVQHSFFTDRPRVFASFEVWLAMMGCLNLLVLGYVLVHAMVSSHRLRDGTTMAIMVAIAAVVCATIWYDEPRLRPSALFAYALFPVAVNNLIWLHFRQALAVSLVGLGLYGGLLVAITDVSLEIRFTASLVVLGVGAMSAWANWRTDRGERIGFLWLTRERLLVEMSRRQNEELREISAIDPLTGIANRRVFEERLRLHADEVGLTLMMIDIDHFKLFNDHYGHLAGDQCLQSVAGALAQQLRGPDDLVARLGGEEFVVLMPGLLEDEIAPVLDRVRTAVERLAIPHAGVRGHGDDVVTISLGCAMSDRGGIEERRALLTRADRALYRAKNDGRNRWCLAAA